MNTQHLQYIAEIERTRSISQAAENLFIGQPNLSRILHDVEAGLGFRIFERTSKGVRPTQRGAEFLQHARNILREAEQIDALGPRYSVANRLRVCIPRAAQFLDLTADYLATLRQDEGLDAVIRECHARQTLELMAAGEAEIGIIRFRSEYQDYFEEQAAMRGLSMRGLNKYSYQLTFARSHPLAGKTQITLDDLADYPEIVHGDTFRAHSREEESQKRKIYTVDRLAQLALLDKVPDSYMWASAMPQKCLDRWGIMQRSCMDNQRVYYDMLLLHQQYSMSEIETGYVNALKQHFESGIGI